MAVLDLKFELFVFSKVKKSFFFGNTKLFNAYTCSKTQFLHILEGKKSFSFKNMEFMHCLFKNSFLRILEKQETSSLAALRPGI